MQITQSVVVITAAGSAIGRAMAMAMHFSQLGAHIALIDTDTSHLQTTLECCQTLKNPCHGYLIKDLEEANIHQIGLKVLQDFGSIDILVNCWQGIVLPNLLSSHSEEHMTQALTLDSTLFFPLVVLLLTI
ncbi:SDR family NAD(P)-dependent oxidoreductase [Photobacterium damselae subsp. piscicida]|uniref:SDR family NAD(P)-dependent oxidoreductase n=1 Tax=Photobacterium damselae TaxID=38293 RepID=UPI0002FC7C94|nr:SDR family NAD(P)-dependent oxidoreductase [Photobacterium damselae]TFZ54105.1 SDR family NAD(P)-dependent oxidoreductase [Photobacterium damselae subsp. piscicida]TJZ87298.1 SDR family NAD(P)-dependent oxidoreductase [Photobacterium damselae subsp. piscicida]